ncbi:MAG: hypothetical protein R2698_11250 [Microthrixaceae bacterium]
MTVTPLSLALDRPPIGASVITPLLGQFAAPIAAARAAAEQEDCNNRARFQILDLVLKALEGNGFIRLSFGGVTVSTAATDFSVSDFGEPAAFGPADLSPPPTTVAPSVLGSTTIVTPTTAAPPATIAPPPPPPAPSPIPGKRGGAALAVGTSALVGLALLAALDRRRLRSFPNRPPLEGA